ncbi:FkbM family methyltransferase [Lacibacterium aquatile]|uniref:FkbM family methyltransferase n=1 Tax=Lacibacterium aquatile TaxID=1168082 RepID=A0ABW5DXB5_9PROT
MKEADLFLVRELLFNIDAYDNKHVDKAAAWLKERLDDPSHKGAARSYLALLMREMGLRPGKNMFDIVRGNYYHVPYNSQIANYAEICEQLFSCKNNGIFFETGAFDGESFSNTCFLADIGWRGVYLEPIQEFYDLCRIRHRVNPNVSVLQGAAGADFGSIDIQLAMMSSTANPAMFAEVEKMEYARPYLSNSVRKAWTFPLNFIFEQAKLPQRFDLMVLDVEGFEYEALAGLDLNYWQPDVVIIELLDQEEGFSGNPVLQESCDRCREKLNPFYEEYISDKGNTIYVRR